MGLGSYNQLSPGHDGLGHLSYKTSWRLLWEQTGKIGREPPKGTSPWDTSTCAWHPPPHSVPNSQSCCSWLWPFQSPRSLRAGGGATKWGPDPHSGGSSQPGSAGDQVALTATMPRLRVIPAFSCLAGGPWGFPPAPPPPSGVPFTQGARGAGSLESGYSRTQNSMKFNFPPI